ncbi:hypothetical protein SSCI18S_00666 [Sphingobium scionense]
MIPIEETLDLNKDRATSLPFPIGFPCDGHITAFGFRPDVDPSNRNAIR